MINRPFLQSQKHKEQHQRALREGAHPDIIEFERVFVARMAKQGIPLFAHNMVRTPSEQKAMYVMGHSKKDGSTPYAHAGCAVDIVHGVMAWNLERESWTMLGHIGMEIALQMGVKLVWGGDWSFYDPAHWELANWRELVGGFPFKGG